MSLATRIHRQTLQCSGGTMYSGASRAHATTRARIGALHVGVGDFVEGNVIVRVGPSS